MIEQWFREGVKRFDTFYSSVGESFIYKGFKLSYKESLGYLIQDVRYSNMYTEVSEEDYKILVKKGFIEGVDFIGFERDTKRVESYTKRTERLYDKKAKFKKELPRKKKLNEKRIRNTILKINEYVGQIFFYNIRIKQYRIKYKLN